MTAPDEPMYLARDLEGRVIYTNLVLGSDGIYGWPTGGFIDPLEIRSGALTVERQPDHLANRPAAEISDAVSKRTTS